MIEGKGLGGKRVVRRSVSFTNKEESDLLKLATACNMNFAELVHEIVTGCMYDSVFVTNLQQQHCTQRAYRVRLVQNEGTVNYVLTGRDDL